MDIEQNSLPICILDLYPDRETQLFTILLICYIYSPLSMEGTIHYEHNVM
jgi:hypothetical protein